MKALKRFFLAALILWCAVLVFHSNSSLQQLQRASREPMPFGIFTLPNGATYAQDFSYNMLYFEGIQERLVEHPYRMADQEKLMRRILPQGATGMTHAYSPVGLVLAQPLLLVAGAERYLIYTALGAIGIVLLFALFLLPQVETEGQITALAVCALSVCVILNFELGQSALLTTSLLGALWALLQMPAGKRPLGRDLLLAILFWALCLKPSVALVPAMLLLGACAWRALGLAAAFLLVTWACTARFYGGWWAGLGDYSHLLNHYNGAEMTAFMQRPYDTPATTPWGLLAAHWSAPLFALDRALILIVSGMLVFLRWTHRIDASTHFCGMIGAFLLVSPYLLPSEDWILCLLVAESAFFQTGRMSLLIIKIFILLGLMDWRGGVTFPIDVNFPLRVILFGWMLAEWRTRRTSRQETQTVPGS